jgi:hypothetical protein
VERIKGEIREGGAGSEEVAYLAAFIEESTRGVLK